jgi:hypothetical protein
MPSKDKASINCQVLPGLTAETMSTADDDTAAFVHAVCTVAGASNDFPQGTHHMVQWQAPC